MSVQSLWDKRRLQILKYIVILLSYLLIIGGLIVNFSRTRPTIPWLPRFVYVEHLLGSFAIGIIFFSLLYFILCIFNKNDPKANTIISFICGLIVPSAVSIYYEIFFQNAMTIEQFPFDILGIMGYWFYIRWAYPDASKIKEFFS